MLTGTQVRMARAALRLTADDLSQSSGVSRATVQRIETFDGEPQSTKANLAAIQRALEAAGVQFIEGGVVHPKSTPAERPSS